MARLALGDYLTGRHIQGGEKGCGAVADGVMGMGHALHAAQTHGQQRLGLVQRLDLRLLVDAKHHRLVRRVQVQADDVPYLFHKQEIGAQLERLLPVRLHRKGLQPAVNGGLGNASSYSQGTGAPMGDAIGGFGLQSPVDHAGNRVVLISCKPSSPSSR